jgi:hypothetical protein
MVFHRTACVTVLLGGALFGALACKSSSPAQPVDGGAFGDGNVATTPGAGGATPGTGGATPGTGGATPGTGGATPGTGGATPGTGGATPGAGGATPGTGGANAGAGGATPGAGGAGGGGAIKTQDSGAASDCSATNLVWKTAQKTNYTSYPAPNSEECIKYSGCLYAGEFAACDGKKAESWVQAHDIVAVFPDFGSLKLHDLCLRSGRKTMVVTVLDECADSDCSGCCTQNQGSADELIDVEKYTDQRWGIDDGSIEWADLGATKTDGCK